MTPEEKISETYSQILRKINKPHLTLDDVAPDILDFFIDTFGADRAEVAIFRDDFDPAQMELTDANAYKLRLTRGYTAEEWEHLQDAGVLERSLRYCLSEKKSMVIPDTSSEPPEDRALSDYLGTGSWMNNVLLLDDRVVAKVHLSKAEKHHYDESHFERLKELSQLLATAVNMAALWERERKLVVDFIAGLNAAMELKDKYTAGHMERVKNYAVGLARVLNLSRHDIDLIEVAAILHDIGKIGISDAILNKTTELDPDEFEAIKQHVPLANHILQNIEYLDEARKIAVLHHERFDGTGYIMGVTGEDLPTGSRIIGIVDAFDAMTSDRPYRKAYYVEEAIDILRTPDMKHWDMNLVDVFLTYLHSREFLKNAVETGLIGLKSVPQPASDQPVYDRENSLLKFQNFTAFFARRP
jgi:HD-GYP domain-containing protein (c-di-GMP phosphodiesterase class II)